MMMKTGFSTTEYLAYAHAITGDFGHNGEVCPKLNII